MAGLAMHCLRLVLFLLVAAPVTAQETLDTPSRRMPEPFEKFQRGTGAVRKIPEETAAETKPKPDSPAPTEKKADSPEPPRFAPFAKRDPFRPFTLGVRSNVRRRENLSPLERFELGQLKLVGVIWDLKHPTAMVEDSAGLGYVVKVGTPIGANDGKVKLIRPDGITIEEFYVDLYGAKKRREVDMKIVAESAP